MAKFIKPGRVAIVVRGKHAGKKVVIVRPMDEGSKSHPFAHAIVVGIERYPLKVTRNMSEKKVKKRSRVKPFVKIYNLTHLMPTRYAIELDNIKTAVSQDTFKDQTQKEEALKTVKKTFEQTYHSGKNKWFFTPLRF